jgi:hypothetical protein
MLGVVVFTSPSIWFNGSFLSYRVLATIWLKDNFYIRDTLRARTCPNIKIIRITTSTTYIQLNSWFISVRFFLPSLWN